MRRKSHDEHSFHGLSRREFVRLAGLAGLAGTAGLSLACSGKETPVATTAAKVSRGIEPRLKIGYLPITDATPLLVGHAQNLFAAEGLQVDRPVMMRGWAEIAEGFLAGSFNLVHLLIPVPIFMRFSQQHPVKVVAWNHMNGSALTVNIEQHPEWSQKVVNGLVRAQHWTLQHKKVDPDIVHVYCTPRDRHDSADRGDRRRGQSGESADPGALRRGSDGGAYANRRRRAGRRSAHADAAQVLRTERHRRAVCPQRSRDLSAALRRRR
jgi:ABC-type nitrate/sulfonate/bicarbonate transport system substrate-binding protein